MYKIIKSVKNFSPKWLTKLVRNNIPFNKWELESLKKTNPYINEPDEVLFPNSSIKVGIIYSSIQYHTHWIAACIKRKVSYHIIYLERSDWMKQVQTSACDVFLVWPDIRTQEIKHMFDERLRIMVEEMGQKIYPSLKEVWLYENKRVQHYWLKHHSFPTPITRVFYDEAEALLFLNTAEYPLVMKSNHGASASGVYIIQDSKEAIKKAKSFLRKGYAPKLNAAGKRQMGSIYIQEYIPNTKEWRMVRIGGSYFGHGKDMTGQFHSGSGKANWDLPPKEAFDLLAAITEKGNFTSMDVDLFETADGKMFINELQTVFGNSIAKEQMKMNGVPGRYVFNESNNFIFEAGSFCENHLCDLRLEYLLKQL